LKTVITLLVCVLGLSTAAVGEGTGLMIAAHGAPAIEWNKAVFEVGRQVESLIGARQGGAFRGSKVAMLEFAEPSIPETMAEFASEGYDRVVVIPLFIAPSGHSHVDLPAALGLYSDQDVYGEFGNGAADVVGSSSMSVIIGPTLASGDILALSVYDQVKEMSTSPEDEAIVILAHGDKGMHPVWDELCRRISAYVCGMTGITYCDWAFVEMGQAFLAEGAPAILSASQARSRVLVPSVYVAMGTDMLPRLWASLGSGGGHHADAHAHTASHGHGGDTSMGMSVFARMLEGVDVQYSSRGLLPDSRVAEWVLEEAESIVERLDGGN
jgi:sirohydrochlorin cobaltochelatase